MKAGAESVGPVVLHITSDPSRLAEVREVVSRLSLGVGFSKDTVDTLVLAVDEALCNVIKHGYGRQPGRPIVLTFDDELGTEHDGIEILVRDYGRQVDPCEIRGRDLEDVRPGGLGVHLITSAMDEVEYTKAEGGGMRLRMRKYLTDRNRA